MLVFAAGAGMCGVADTLLATVDQKLNGWGNIKSVSYTHLDVYKRQLYDTGEIDTIDLAEANLRAIYEDENNQYHDYLTEKLPKKFSYQMKFNYAKKNEDGSDDTNWNTRCV